MLIQVTQSHIDRGCRGDGQACPVALALEEATGQLCLVDQVSIVVGRGPDSFCVPTPAVVTNWIIKYDQSVHGMRPFEFELNVEGVG